MLHTQTEYPTPPLCATVDINPAAYHRALHSTGATVITGAFHPSVPSSAMHLSTAYAAGKTVPGIMAGLGHQAKHSTPKLQSMVTEQACQAVQQQLPGTAAMQATPYHLQNAATDGRQHARAARLTVLRRATNTCCSGKFTWLGLQLPCVLPSPAEPWRHVHAFVLL